MTDDELAQETERQIRSHGGLHASLIRDSLKWLNEHELSWNLPAPVNRECFVDDLVSHPGVPQVRNV